MQSAPPRPTAPPRHDVPLRAHARSAEPRGPASALAFGLTLVGCWIIAATAQRLHVGREGASPRPDAGEQIVYVAPLDATPDEPIVIVPASATPASTAPATRFPVRDARASSMASPDRMPRTPGDTAAGAARPTVPARAGTAAPPSPGAVFRSPVGAPLCLPPCGVAPSVGLGRRAPALDLGQMDSALQVIRGAVRTAPTRGGGPSVASGPSTLGGAPAVSAGVSIPVGLPGGGPSAEQRRRDSVANAGALARLAGVRQRTDSLTRRRLDSLARTRPPRP